MGPAKYVLTVRAGGEPLWLELRAPGIDRIFLMQPADERAIVVGSLMRADIRLDRRDIAPVHFHFEREGSQIWLVPTYKADLRVNAARIVGPFRLEGQACIEFCGLVLDAIVHRENPLSGAFPIGAEPQGLDRERARTSYIDELPDETAPTRAVLKRLDSADHEPPNFETVRISTASADSLSVSIMPARIVDGVRTERFATPLHARDVAAEHLAASHTGSTQTFVPLLPDARHSENTAEAMLPKSTKLIDWDIDRPAARHPRLDDLVSACRRRSGARFPWVTALGLVAKRHPIGILIPTLVCTLLLMLALIGIDHLLK